MIAGLRSLLSGGVAYAALRMGGMKLKITRHSVLAGVALCLTLTLFCTANKLTTAANAIVLQFTDPVFIVILSALFFRKRFSRADILAVALTFGGVSLFFVDKLGTGNFTGDLVGLASGLAFGCYYMSLEASPEDERMSAIVIANVLTFLVGLPFIFLTRPVFAGLSLLYIFILGVFQLGIPYVLLAKGSEHCPPLVCALMGAVEPLLNPLWVFIFDGERPGALALMGGVIIITTITSWCIWNARHEDKTV